MAVTWTKELPGTRLVSGDTVNQLIDTVNGVTAGTFTNPTINGGQTVNGTAAFNGLVNATAGLKQSGPNTTVFASVTATGTTQLGAKAISASFPMTWVIQCSTASTKGVRLPAAVTGRTIKIANSGAFGVKVYPSTNGKIGAASTNAADSTSLAVNKINTYVALNTTFWAVERGA